MTEFNAVNRQVVFEVLERRIEFGVAFQATGTGEANTGANVGGGTGNVFRDKTGVALNHKTINGTGGITITDNADTIDVDGAGAGSGAPWVKDEFTPTIGQVTFILSSTPTDLASLTLVLNGTKYDDVTDYVVSGTTVTWLDPFTLKAKDKLIIQYK